MKIPTLTIGKLVADIPIVQGGMGVRVSRASLAAAVANEGGIGTISSIGLGDIEASKTRYEEASRDALREEIRRAKALTSGLLAVNLMGVLSNAYDMVRAAVEEGIQIIVYGAGLPSKLPAVVEDPDVALVPIVSSARVTDLILRTWGRRYDRVPDAFILEGPLAGGHLGFSREQLEDPENFFLEKLLPQVLAATKPYEQKHQKPIPVIAAGGIFDGKDIARMLSLGAVGVQMGTRFVCTHECKVSDEFKQTYLDASEEDILIIDSPVGMPARAIKTTFLETLGDGGKVRCPYRCLTACKAEKAKYCIARVLVNAYLGKVQEGVVFCGQNAHRITKIVTVPELIKELLADLAAAPEPSAA